MNIKERIRKMGPFIALVVTFIVIAALNDSFVDPNNLKNLLRQVSINALISFGMTFVILTGGIDLSVGSLLALSSALMGSLIVSGMNPMLAILAACFIGMGLGRCQRLSHCLRQSSTLYRYARHHDHLSRSDTGIYQW